MRPRPPTGHARDERPRPTPPPSPLTSIRTASAQKPDFSDEPRRRVDAVIDALDRRRGRYPVSRRLMILSFVAPAATVLLVGFLSPMFREMIGGQGAGDDEWLAVLRVGGWLAEGGVGRRAGFAGMAGAVCLGVTLGLMRWPRLSVLFGMLVLLGCVAAMAGLVMPVVTATLDGVESGPLGR